MRRPILLMVAGLTIAFTAWFAFAAVTWKSGPTGSFNADATSFTVTGEATGLGNVPAVAHVAVNGTVSYTCEKGHISEVHFDANHHLIVEWEEETWSWRRRS